MLVHLNGQLLPHDKAHVSVFDRGFVFGDGVYEGIRTTARRDGSPGVIGLDLHVRRMGAGLEESRILGFDAAQLGRLTDALVRANGLVEANVYWQVTRGTPPTAPWRARLPHPDARPTVFGFATPCKPVAEYTEPECRRVSIRPDTRWTRGHLKSISLHGGVLAAIEAHEQSSDDAILVRDGRVTEGVATNVFLASGDRLVTPALDSAPMLDGATRALILRDDPSIEVRPVSVDELHQADEVMLTGTYTMVSAVVSLDGRPIGRGAGAGKAGPMSRQLLRTLVRAIEKDVE